MSASPDFEAVLHRLVTCKVRFVLIERLAMIAQGACSYSQKRIADSRP
jgi:hypothetical protein